MRQTSLRRRSDVLPGIFGRHLWYLVILICHFDNFSIWKCFKVIALPALWFDLIYLRSQGLLTDKMFLEIIKLLAQFVIFKPLSYCFKQTIGFDVKASFASGPLSRLIRWCNKPGDKTKEFWEKAISSTGLFMDWKLQTELMKT